MRDPADDFTPMELRLLQIQTLRLRGYTADDINGTSDFEPHAVHVRELLRERREAAVQHARNELRIAIEQERDVA